MSMTDTATEPDADRAPVAGAAFLIPVLAGPESTETLSESDPRVFPPGCFTWADTPLPLNMMSEITPYGGHTGSKVGAGRLDLIWRNEGEGTLSAIGRFGTTEVGECADTHVTERTLTAVSVDPRDYTVNEVWEEDEDGFMIPVRVEFPTYVIGGATIVDTPGFETASIEPLSEDGYTALMAAADPSAEMAGWVMLASGDTAAPTLIRVDGPPSEAVTLVPHHDDCGCGTPDACSCSTPHITVGVPNAPADVLDKPELSGPTVMAAGIGEWQPWGVPVAFHLCEWGDCHTALGCSAQPVASRIGYSRFVDTGDVVTLVGGGEHAVGHVNVYDEHAPERHDDGRWVTEAEARAFYAALDSNRGALVAGGDSVGIYLTGYFPPDTDRNEIGLMLESYFSGDWRAHNGHLELMHASRVDLPGFPVGEQKVMVRTASAGFDGVDPQVLLGFGTGRLAAMVAARQRKGSLSAPRAVIREDPRVDDLADRLARVERLLDPDMKAAARRGLNGSDAKV